jgi:serine/threonine-protein kinase
MGSVFLAEQVALGGRPVALKVLNRKLLDDPEFLLRFHDEGASTARIRHPNVVTIYESGQTDDGTPYIAMEYLEGVPLREALRRRGALPVAECAEILQQAARGLNAAHRLGIIHRDLKPDNLFLTRGDEGDLIVKIVDFGIAKLRESATHTLTGTVLGTPAYMSSEQASGMRSDQLDARSDIYSLGVVAYEMLAGRVPFHSDTPLGYVRKHLLEEPPPFRAVAPGLSVPAQVEAVVMKALAKDREQRYGSVLDFAREFARAAAPPSAEPTEPLATTRAVEPPIPDVGAVREPPLQAPGVPLPPAAPTAPAPDVGAVGEPPLHPPAVPVAPVAPTAPAPDVGARRRLAPTAAGPSPSPKKPSHAAIAGVIAAVAVMIVAGLVWVYWPTPPQTPRPAQRGTVRENPKDGLKYVWIPPGTFMMGCSPGDSECYDQEKPAHQVTITRGFWIGQTPVTVGAYKRFAGATVRQMPEAPNFNNGWTNENMPIVNVNWDDAQAYCGWMGGRLPTEAEWEYAARGGSTEARYGPLDEVAWYDGNSGNQTHDVAQKRANGFGLYDMLGNVWGWVNDWYDEHYYQGSPSQDPQGPASGQSRVLRGGSWYYNPRYVRVSTRFRLDPASWYIGNGFRCGGEVVNP